MFNLEGLAALMKPQGTGSTMFPGMNVLNTPQIEPLGLDVNTALNPAGGGTAWSKLSDLLSGPRGMSLISMLGATGAALAPENSWQQRLGASAGGLAQGQMLVKALGQKGAGNDFLNQWLLSRGGLIGGGLIGGGLK